MKAKRYLMGGMLLFGSLMFVGGCAGEKKLPALYETMPVHAELEKPRLIEKVAVPGVMNIPLVIDVHGSEVGVEEGDSLMGREGAIRRGSSVVISVPDGVYKEASQKRVKVQSGFQTAGYFNVLEQYVERGLIGAGLHVKDRAKFEAKLRDLRDSGDVVRRADNPYNAAFNHLRKDLDSGKLTREEYADQALALRDKMLDPSRTSKNREELTDISEVIRAAKDGDVVADYVLQVNELAVTHYKGVPMQLMNRKEVQEVLVGNPGLRLGRTGEEGAIPTTLEQPWAQARFNAKLIDVKTGQIDWIGEYAIDSLSVLRDGVQIYIGVRKHVTNGESVVNRIEKYNKGIERTYKAAWEAERMLVGAYQEAMREIDCDGVEQEMKVLQEERRAKVDKAEDAYMDCLDAYRDAMDEKPGDEEVSWRYAYDVDDAVVTPDLLRPRTEEEGRRLIQHIRKLGAKVTRDLLKTIDVSK